MSKKRIFLSFAFPPFAVVDKGCGQYLLTFILTCLGWVPGIICALVILKLEQRKNRNNKDGAKKQIEKLQNKQSSSSSSFRANKLQSRISSRNKRSGVNSSLSDMQSPFNRKRRMNNNDNNQGWQRW